MKKIFIAIIAFLVVAAGAFIFIKKARKPVSMQEIQPKRGSIAMEFRETGTVNPRNRLEIKPQIGGRIEDILVVEGQKVKKGEIIAWMSSTDRAALLDVARSKGKEELKKWEDTYKPTPIISPIDGFIIARSKEPGQTVSVGDVILVMADSLIVEADVDETDLRYLKLGQEVEMFLDAYPDDKFDGLVEHIAYESDIVNNVVVYKVKIRPVEVLPNFRAGMTATIEVTANQKDGALLIPSDLISTVNNKKFVTVKNGTKSEQRQVETGLSNGRRTEILSGLTEDDIVLAPQKDSKKPGSQMRGMGLPGMGGGRR